MGNVTLNICAGASLVFAAFTGASYAEQPQSTHPVFSPDGSKIAFINNSIGVGNDNAINFEVYTMNADGSGVQRHTFNTAFEAEISWSQDGSRLAVKSYRDANDEVYVFDLKGGEQKNVSSHPARDGSPFWSNMPSKLYFQSERDHPKGELYSYDTTTGATTRLTHNDFTESSAEWSPAHDKIAFVSNKDGDDDIYVMDASGDNLQQITNNALNDWYPKWSPDGRKILFTYGDWNTDVWEIRVIDLADKSQKTLIKQVDSGNASWHPSGGEIAFASSRTGPGEVYLYDLKTGGQIQITETANGFR